MKQQIWEYARTELINVYDGDTITVSIDLGFYLHKKNVKIRLYGINTPEIRTKDKHEKTKGIAVRDWLRERLSKGKFSIKIVGKGKYGRWLGILYINGKNIVAEMIKKGLGEEYYGGSRKKS